jgi:hypothetical protein
MSIIGMEGFDALGTVDGAVVGPLLQSIGSFVSAGSFNLKVGANTRTGIGAAILQNSLGALEWAFPDKNRIIWGGAIKREGHGAFMALKYDDHAGNIAGIVYLCNSETGCIVVNTGGDGYADTNTWTSRDGYADTNTWTSRYVSDPNIINLLVWYYVEIDILLSSTGTGWIKVRVDGVAVLNIVNINVGRTHSFNNNNNTSGLYVGNFVKIGYCDGNGTEGATWYDDMYLLDGAGTVNTMLGDCVVHAVMPVADTGDNDFAKTGGTGADHATAVNEKPTDEDTSYLQSSGAGQREIFTIDTIPADIVTVIAVSVENRIKKTSAGSATARTVCKLGVNETDSGDIAVPSTYNTKQTIFEEKPGGGAWSKTEAQAIEIGLQIQ